MAAVTITADANLDGYVFSTLNHNETVTINNGAILTIDSDVLCTTSSWSGPNNVQFGSITINDGTVLIDGTRTRQVDFIDHAGNVPWTRKGRWQMTASNGTMGEPIAYYFSASSPTVGTVKFRSLTGPLVSGSMLSYVSASSTGSATASIADTTGWLVVSMTEGSTITTTRQATFKVTGSWYYLNTGSGVAPQYIPGYIGKYMPASGSTSAPQGSIPAIWVERSASTEIYDTWVNLTATGTALNPNATASLDSTRIDPRGFNFVHVNNQQYITCSFGTATTRQGYTIPLSAKVKVPNIHFIGATSAGRNTSSINTTIATWPDFTTTAAGTINIDKMLSTALYFSLSQPYDVIIKNAGVQGLLSITEVGNETYIDNIGVGRAQGLSPASTIVFTGNYGMSTIKDSTIIGQSAIANSATAGNVFLFTSCKNILVTGSYIVGFGRTGTTGVANTLNNVAGVDIGDCIFVGALTRVSQFSSDITLRNNLFLNNSTSSLISDPVVNPAYDFLQTTDILIDREQRTFRGGNTAYGGLYQFTSCDGIEMKNIGTLEQPYNIGIWNTGSITQSTTPWAAYPVTLVNYNLNTKMSRCYFTQSRTGFVNTNNSNDTVFMQNCMSDINDQLIPTSRNTFCRGMTIGNTMVGSTTGVANSTTLQAGYGTHFYDAFAQGDFKTGSIGIVCTEQNPSYFYSSGSYEISGSTTITGSPEFNSNGGLLLRESQSYVIWTWPMFIKGHAGFLNVPAIISCSNSAPSSSLIEYQLDKGAGFPGTWTSASAANLAAESGINLTTGFRPKIKATCRITHPNNQLVGISFYTSTSLSLQATTSLYPIDTVITSLELTDLQPHTEVRIYESGSGLQLAVNEDTGTTFSYAYTWEGTDLVVDIILVNLTYEYIRYENIVLGSAGLTIPIQQRFDRNYSNPPGEP